MDNLFSIALLVIGCIIMYGVYIHRKPGNQPGEDLVNRLLSQLEKKDGLLAAQSAVLNKAMSVINEIKKPANESHAGATPQPVPAPTPIPAPEIAQEAAPAVPTPVPVPAVATPDPIGKVRARLRELALSQLDAERNIRGLGFPIMTPEEVKAELVDYDAAPTHVQRWYNLSPGEYFALQNRGMLHEDLDVFVKAYNDQEAPRSWAGSPQQARRG